MADEYGCTEPSACCSDKENSSSSEGVVLLRDPQNLDLNDFETIEELDFEDEKKYSNVLQTSIQQNIKPESLNGTKNVDNGSESKCTPSNEGKENCEDGEIEEGETLEDADIEDGEISEGPKAEDLQKSTCRFFLRGKCIWGRECRYLHLSDKGLYCMFDSPVKHKKPPMPNLCYPSDPQFMYPIPPPPPQPLLPPIRAEKIHPRPWVEKSPESIWDKALQEAKERIKKSRTCQDNGNYIDDLMHLKVEKTDRYVKKLTTSKYSPDRHSSPESDHGIVDKTRVSHSDHRRKCTDAAKSNLSRSVGDRNSSFHSEWTDPWRRSKTPPQRKRNRSKSISDSSSVSSKSSLSSWTSRSSRSPSPKRIKSLSTKQKYGHSNSSKFKKSRSSSGSPRSASSRSLSYSPEFHSKRGKGKSFRSPSTSPVYHRRKRHRSPDIVLPYKKPSRSPTPPPLVKKKIVPKELSKEKLLPKEMCPALQVSRASNQRISGVRQSCSDMSISPLSDSKISISPFTVDQAKRNISAGEKTNARAEERPSKLCLSGANMIPLGNSSQSSESEPTPKFKPMQIKPPNETKIKTMKELESDFLRFTGFRKPRLPPKKAQPKSQPPVSGINVASKKEDNSVKEDSSKQVKVKQEPVSDDESTSVPDQKLSKRDILLQKLRAVEEAIARKKKALGSVPQK